jgi:probable rRNA maturation factor
MFSYTLINTVYTCTLDTARLDQICRLISEQVDLPQNGIINIAWLPDDEIQILNRDYRGIDRTTDVLSFHYAENFEDITSSDVAGECILSESRILAQAHEHGHSPETECEILIIHSILHILGYDHETDGDYADMWQYEEVIRREMGVIDKLAK